MQKSLLFFSFSLLIFIKGISQTNVSGPLNANTVWTKAASPYVLTGNLVVSAGVTLTIQPGVTITRTEQNQIIINGSLLCNGTEADSIFFVTNDQSDITVPAFLQFLKCNLSNSSIRFAGFKNLYLQSGNIRIGNETESASPLKNSGILNIARSKITKGNVVAHGFNSAESLNLDSCYLDSCVIRSADQYSERINIYNSTVSNSTELTEAYSYGIMDSGCIIKNVVLESGSHSDITVLSSDVSISSFNVLYNSILNISSSSLVNTPVIGIPGGKVNINASTISVENADTSLFPKINNNIYLVEACQANITNSTLKGITGLDALAISGVSATETIDTSSTVAHNTFSGFSDAATVYNFSNEIHIDSNNFEGIDIYDIINYSAKNFAAVYNYYQLKTGQVVNDVIYDERDNPAFGLVNYMPVANEPVLPLHLISFTGSYGNGQVTLKWQTSGEINTSSFAIQRLVNGSYQDMGNIPAKGGANNSYFFIPNSLTDGSNIYRLKMIDKDGSYSYSSSLRIDVSSGSIAIKIYPNPATHYILISHAKADATSQLQLTGMDGKLIKTVIVAKDDVQNRITTDGLTKGVYKVTWRSGNSVQTGTVLIQ